MELFEFDVSVKEEGQGKCKWEKSRLGVDIDVELVLESGVLWIKD